MDDRTRVSGSSSVTAPPPPTVDSQMFDILNNPRMSEDAKVAALEKAVANLPEAEKKALYERLKDKKSQDPLAKQLHYRLSHHPDKPGKLSTVDQVLSALKGAPGNGSASTQDAKSTNPPKGSSPASMDQKTADAVARDHISKQVAATDKKAGAAAVLPDDGLKPGQSISAQVTREADGMHFQFQRPVTQEQAAALIFQKGKVPDGAKLVQGKGNSWIVKMDMDAHIAAGVVKHFNSHTETVIQPPRLPSDQTFPESLLTFTWVGGAPKTSTAGPTRSDLKNDMGFTIKNKYRLDEGQRSTAALGQKGMGYELGFQKPMTKDEVMNSLFDKHKITQGEVRLIPMTPEPATQWKVEVMGSDALTAFKRNAFRAFGDASVYGKESLPTGTPAGVRSHIENKTVPKDAVKHEPDVYVWEQDGYMMYVKTNNKGKDGYYEPQITKMPNDEPGRIWLRYYMKDNGMPPREAWQTFWNDTVEVTKMQLAMISNAIRAPQVMRVGTPKSSFGDSPSPSPRIRSRMSGGGNIPKSNTIVESPPPPPPRSPGKPGGPGGPSSDTIVSHPPPMPKVKTAPKVVTTRAPEPPPPPAAKGGGTKADSQPPAPPPPTPGKGKTLPGSLYRKVGKQSQPPPEISWFPKKSGTKLSTEQVLEINRVDSSRIGWSMTPKEHLAQWKAANPGSNEPPPVAFTTRDGRVVVNEEAWIKSGQPSLWGLEPQ